MTACPDELELARAVTEGAEPELSAHLVACATCTATWDATMQAIELARSLEVPMPTRDRREEMRTAILAASGALVVTPPDQSSTRSSSRSGPQRWWLVGAAFAAAAALAFVLARPDSVAESRVQPHGTVTAHAGARFVTSSPAPDEVVTLHDGVIDVEVSPLQPGERFRVVTADTEVEVRGTAFEVAAELGHVTRVDVRHGVVEVRPHGGAVVILAAGEVWRAPVRTAVFEPAAPPAAPTTSPMPTAPTASTTPTAPTASTTPASPSGPAQITRPVAARDRRETPSAPATTTAPAAIVASPSPGPALAISRPPTAIAYDEAWDAMRGGRFERAASTFARVAILDPDGPLAEDASYWYPVALARAKRGEAVSAFREFLERYPSSAHASEASVMLGWLLVEAKQPAEAERRFRAAIDDASSAVRESARAGLSAVSGR